MLLRFNCLAILLTVLFFSSYAIAKDPEKCDFELLQTALSETLNLDLIPEKPQFQRPKSVISVNCKTLPNDANLLITAINYDKETPSNAGLSSPSSQADSINFALALIDKKNKRVHRIYRSSLEQDAITRFDYGWTIDTAAYQLSPDVRAFALRGGSDASKCQYDGGFYDEFHLFADLDGKLHRLYEGGPVFQMQKDRVSGNSCGLNNFSEIHHNIDLFFSMAQSSSYGLKDIHVFAKIKSEWLISDEYEKEFRNKMRMDLTLPKDQRIHVGTLRFNGKTYVGDTNKKIEEIFAERSKISEKFIKRAQQAFPSN